MEIKNNLKSIDFVKILQEYKRIFPLARILAMVEEAGCQTIVTEDAPPEFEYKKEHEVFFRNVFSTSEHDKVHRLHFFAGNIADIQEIQEKDERYLGYCDIRPTRAPSLSCAVLDRKIFVKENGNFLFLVCQRKFLIPFGECNLQLFAFPYVQQDGRVIRCAQAALAAVSLYYGNSLTGPDFTNFTSEIPDGHRNIPSRGMTAQQIGISWEKLGMEPVLYDYMLQDYAKDENQAELQHREQVIYRYLESGIPVIIGIDAGAEMHALVVVGHTFTPDSWQAETKTTYYRVPKSGFYYHCCTDWIERFVVQDDNLGPYTLILSDFLQFFGCKLITVGLPEGIYLMPEDAEAFVGDLLCPSYQNITSTFDYFVKQFNEAGGKQDPETVFWYEEFKFHAKTQDLVLRTYLRKSEDWKNSVKGEESYSEYEQYLNSTPLPEYVWVIEISWPYIFRHGRNHCGVVLVDPTDEISPLVNTLDQGWLWIKVPGLVMYRNAKNGDKAFNVLEREDKIKIHHYTSS